MALWATPVGALTPRDLPGSAPSNPHYSFLIQWLRATGVNGPDQWGTHTPKITRLEGMQRRKSLE